MAKLFLATGIAVGLVALLSRVDLPVWPAPERDPPPAAVRIAYSAHDLPALALPDGETRPVRSLLNVTRPMHYGDFEWNEAGVPQGPVWVRIDLARQSISLFRAGHEIGTAVILYGMDDTPTPTGTFPILETARMHESGRYQAAMPYMLRLTPDGVAIHAAEVRKGFATHGCIGVPLRFAELLFGQVHRGDMVVIAPATGPATRS